MSKTNPKYDWSVIDVKFSSEVKLVDKIDQCEGEKFTLIAELLTHVFTSGGEDFELNSKNINQKEFYQQRRILPLHKRYPILAVQNFEMFEDRLNYLQKVADGAQNYEEISAKKWQETPKIWYERFYKKSFCGVNLSNAFMTTFRECLFDKDCILPSNAIQLSKKYFLNCSFDRDLIDNSGPYSSVVEQLGLSFDEKERCYKTKSFKDLKEEERGGVRAEVIPDGTLVDEAKTPSVEVNAASAAVLDKTNLQEEKR